MLETNLVEKNMETYFHHGHGNLLISLHRRVNKKPKMLGITVLLVYMLTEQTNFICSNAYIQFFCVHGWKKWATLVPLLLSAKSIAKLLNMWLTCIYGSEPERTPLLLFWQMKAVLLVWSLRRSFWIRNNLKWIKRF